MRLKENFVLEQIAGETVAIYCANDTVDFRRAISLNGSAQIMFKSLLEDTSREKLVVLLMDGYGVSKEKAEEDVDSFLKLLYNNNLLDG